MSKKQYYPEINLMRGCLALLVVLGHITTQFELDASYTSTGLFALGKIIYSFHMALFFAISGFVSVKALFLESIEDKMSYTKSRFMRLLVPYFAMGILYLPFRIIMSSIARNQYNISDFWKILIGENPDGALWFLFVLFIYSVLAGWITTMKNINFTIVVSAVVCVITLIFDFPQTLDRLLYFSVYYFIGVYVRLHYDTLKESMDRIWIKTSSVIAFFLSNCVICMAAINSDSSSPILEGGQADRCNFRLLPGMVDNAYSCQQKAEYCL